ncbi:hypothetical protein MAM1_0071c04157 [Mucor ambiguus]|uniref:BTB domain-containing protein n=1 Tax=Mucor ambiguus TaxID=91626 RepID=A0A0C9MRN7_9FUNG|nr:hypothetical protein MAM1_0071c04157 [Mucor ambiguus]
MDNNFKLVTLNVGGKTFITYYENLKQSDYFQDLIQNKKGEQAIAIKGKAQQESFFIDRDGDTFEAIMHYLRTYEIIEKDPDQLRILEHEAKFFKLKSMAIKINQAIADTSNNETYAVKQSATMFNEMDLGDIKP